MMTVDPKKEAKVETAPQILDLDHPQWYLNRELTWLNFNKRVLNEGRDPRVPLLERLFLWLWSAPISTNSS